MCEGERARARERESVRERERDRESEKEKERARVCVRERGDYLSIPKLTVRCCGANPSTLAREDTRRLDATRFTTDGSSVMQLWGYNPV